MATGDKEEDDDRCPKCPRPAERGHVLLIRTGEHQERPTDTAEKPFTKSNSVIHAKHESLEGSPAVEEMIESEVKSLSRVRLFATPWTVAYKAPPSMGFSRQKCWSGVLCLLQGIFPAQESNPCLLHCRQTLYRLSHQGSPGGNDWVVLNPMSPGS